MLNLPQYSLLLEIKCCHSSDSGKGWQDSNCFYCSYIAHNVIRHIKSVHRREEKVMVILKTTDKKQSANLVSLLRLLGNHQYNLKQRGETMIIILLSSEE